MDIERIKKLAGLKSVSTVAPSDLRRIDESKDDKDCDDKKDDKDCDDKGSKLSEMYDSEKSTKSYKAIATKLENKGVKPTKKSDSYDHNMATAKKTKDGELVSKFGNKPMKSKKMDEATIASLDAKISENAGRLLTIGLGTTQHENLDQLELSLVGIVCENGDDVYDIYKDATGDLWFHSGESPSVIQETFITMDTLAEHYNVL